MSPVIAAYVSGHGFGHFTRSAAVLERLALAGCEILVRTGGVALPLARQASWATEVAEVDSGPMVAQRGPFASDVPATLRAAQAHLAQFEQRVAAEARWLQSKRASLVYADHPPLAIEGAAAAGVPSVSMGNFTWSWILDGFGGDFASIAQRLARAEAQATLHLMLPFSAGMDHISRREAVPLVVRQPTRTAQEARGLLPVPSGEKRPVVLVSFGGFAGGPPLREAARRNPGYFFVAFSDQHAEAENLTTLPHYHGFPHQDLVLGADALICKPGYGTIAEAIAARRPIAFVPREGFRETDVLVPAMQRTLPCAAISMDDLVAGRWAPALDRALAMDWPLPPMRTDGAEVVAQKLLALCRSP